MYCVLIEFDILTNNSDASWCNSWFNSRSTVKQEKMNIISHAGLNHLKTSNILLCQRFIISTVFTFSAGLILKFRTRWKICPSFIVLTCPRTICVLFQKCPDFGGTMEVTRSFIVPGLIWRFNRIPHWNSVLSQLLQILRFECSTTGQDIEVIPQHLEYWSNRRISEYLLCGFIFWCLKIWRLEPVIVNSQPWSGQAGSNSEPILVHADHLLVHIRPNDRYSRDG